jgi:hypothetical protein
MANALYDPGREGFLDGTIDFDTDTIEALLVRGYTFSAADKFETALTSAGTIVARFTLASVTKTNGIADAADGVWTAVASGAAIPAIVILSNKGSAATNRLIAYIDTATGLPVTPNGGNINVAWDNGSNKIFKL